MDKQIAAESQADKPAERVQVEDGKCHQWKKPVLEDVSGRIMAQPYIRFT